MQWLRSWSYCLWYHCGGWNCCGRSGHCDCGCLDAQLLMKTIVCRYCLSLKRLRANVWATIYVSVALRRLAWRSSTPKKDVSINGMPLNRWQTGLFKRWSTLINRRWQMHSFSCHLNKWKKVQMFIWLVITSFINAEKKAFTNNQILPPYWRWQLIL